MKNCPASATKFELFFAMKDDQDPQNVTNDVISVLTTPAFPQAYYDLFTFENRTLEQDQDTVKAGR
jgi:hypothetical protein